MTTWLKKPLMSKDPGDGMKKDSTLEEKWELSFEWDPKLMAGLALQDVTDSCLVGEETLILIEVDETIEEEADDKIPDGEEHCTAMDNDINDDNMPFDNKIK